VSDNFNRVQSSGGLAVQKRTHYMQTASETTIILTDDTTSSTKEQKTYNSGYSLVVTHLTTNPPVRCLNRAERTGSLVFNVLWSYVEDLEQYTIYILNITRFMG
jgi:hypothetical protein